MLRIMKIKYPKSCKYHLIARADLFCLNNVGFVSDEDFGVVAFAFYNFRKKLRHLIEERSTDLEVLDSQFKRGEH